jgi:hypothetical protein
MSALTVRKWDRRPIVMPGIVSGIPIYVYHSGWITDEPSISSTGLRAIYNPAAHHSKSPAHYWVHSPYNPDRAEMEETSSIILGRAAHHLLFGEKAFKELFAIRPDTLNGTKWNGNRLECKDWLQEQDQKGLTVVTTEQIDKIRGIAERLQDEPLVKNGLLNGLIEHSAFAKDPETGIWLRIRPDAMPNDSLDFVDLKVVKSIRDHDLQKSIENYGYYQQGALVQTVVRQITGANINSFTLVFAESSPPHCIEIRTLKAEDLARGEKVNRVGLRKFAQCWQDKRWPGPSDGRADARYIELGEWAGKRIDEAVEEEMRR